LDHPAERTLASRREAQYLPANDLDLLGSLSGWEPAAPAFFVFRQRLARSSGGRGVRRMPQVEAAPRRRT
jgi:hypothetical protein